MKRPCSATPSRDWLLEDLDTPVEIDFNKADGKLTMSNEVISRTWHVDYHVNCVSYRNEVETTEYVRSVRPEAIVTLDETEYTIGGGTSQPVQNYLDETWVDSERSKNGSTGHFEFSDYSVDDPERSRSWEPRFGAFETDWPPTGKRLTLQFAPSSEVRDAHQNITVEVHYELYQGTPMMGTWVTVRNDGETPVTIDEITTEQLALPLRYKSRFHAEPEYAVGSMFPIFWETQDEYETRSPPMQLERPMLDQIHWRGLTANDGDNKAWENPAQLDREERSVLSVRYPIGPATPLVPGTEFSTFKTYEILHDSDDPERQGLERRQMYRRLAPWTQENPIFTHVTSADTEDVKRAIDQAAAVGFEMVILSFGSKFDMLTDDPHEIKRYQELFEYAEQKGIDIGGYILFASSISHGEHDIVDPETGDYGDMFGRSLCLGTAYSDEYFEKLLNFIDETGMTVIETDGPYHGMPCGATDHEYHDGVADSYRVNWERQSKFYQRCIERGLYINSPDWYFFSGSNKIGIGYREKNWSLPREQQLLIGRQDIFDGTFDKTASMGWTFVPLVEYHGGGEAATLEPLHEHLDSYEAHLAQNFGSGVMGTYRGPRLYDTAETKEVVKKWVDFYHEHRDILNSDTIHVRRPDGRDIDCMMKVNSELPTRGLVMVYNPLNEDVTRTLDLPLYYTGLTESATVRHNNGQTQSHELDESYNIHVEVTIPSNDRVWFLIEPP